MTDCDKPMLCCGYCCVYSACDFNDMAVCFHRSCDCLCFRHSCCLAIGVEPRGVGCTADNTKGECCMIGCFCCDCGIVAPKVLCSSYSKCLCMHDACASPSSSQYLDECVCAVCCLSCAPTCGCCKEAPECPAIDLVKSGQSVDPKAPVPEPRMGR